MKRIISFIIAISIISASAIFTANANEFEYSMHEKEVIVLTELGITTEGESGALNEDLVTRAELAALAMKALGYSDISLSEHQNPFTDLITSHWAYDYIMLAYSIGLFNGTSQTTFAPDAIIDSSQAVATMIKMLNYKSHAELTGGYPTGYWATAVSCKILDGLNINMSSSVTREQLYVLLYNTIHAEMLVESGINGTDESFVKDGSTILSHNLNIKYVEGVITADSEGAISGSIAESKDRFYIGNMLFEGRSINTTGKVGRRVRVYYRDTNSSIYEALCIWEEENTEITLAADSILNFDYTSGIYKAFDGDKEKSFKIGNKYYLSYNGETIAGSDPLYMKPSSGNVTLIDNNLDGIYDVVLVNEFYNLIFGGYNPYTNIITDKLDSAKNLDLELYKSITSNVEDYSALEQNTVLSVFKGRTNNSVKIKNSGNVVSGTITEVSSEGGYVINGAEYKLSLNPRCTALNLNAGKDYTLYLDAYNGIAYYELVSSSQGGYALKISVSSSLEPSKIQMLTLDGTLKVFELADKVTIETPNGISSISGNDVHSYFNGLTGSKRLYVLFNQNSKKQINKIIMPKVIKTQPEYESMGGYPLYKMDYYLYNWPKPSTSGYLQYKNKNMGYGNWLILGEGTVVLNVVPETQTEYSADDFICGSVKNCLRPDETITLRTNNEGNKGNREIDVYKLGDSGYEPEILIKYTTGVNKNVSDDNDFIVIKDINEVLNAATGDVEYKLTYMQGATESTAVLAKDFSNDRAQILSSPYSSSMSTPSLNSSKQRYECGDIAKISKDISGRIVNLCLIYDAKNKAMSFPTLTDFNRIFRIIDGTVEFIDNGYIEIRTNTESLLERSRINGCNIIVVENYSNEVRKGTTADINEGDPIVIYSRYNDNKTVVVYKNRR